jgi:TPR repeat protein
MQTKQYDRALNLAQKTKTPSRRVHELLLEADKRGDLRATYSLATWYLHGSPFTKIDRTRAAKLLQRAAVEVASAAYDLAVSYETGAGVRKSEARAFENYVRAALLGDAQSVYEVGRMYFHGLGVAKNRRLAEIWLARASTLGIED